MAGNDGDEGTREWRGLTSPVVPPAGERSVSLDARFKVVAARELEDWAIVANDFDHGVAFTARHDQRLRQREIPSRRHPAPHRGQKGRPHTWTVGG